VREVCELRALFAAAELRAGEPRSLGRWLLRIEARP
jgi:hypothetical protein